MVQIEVLDTVSAEELAANPQWNQPFPAAIRVTGGQTVYVSGLNAAPIYHSHPHVPSEFDDIPLDPRSQAELTINGLKQVLELSGAKLTDVVQLFIFVVDMEANGNAINQVFGEHFQGWRPTSTMLEVVSLSTDPRLVLEITATAVI